jgi:hypothetical protein
MNRVPYSKINPEELRDLEAEFGHPLTPDLALWMIRARMNREAVERMQAKPAPPQLKIRQKHVRHARPRRRCLRHRPRLRQSHGRDAALVA